MDVEKDFNSRGGEFNDGPAVLGDVHGLEAEVGAHLHVVCCLDAFGHGWKGGRVLKLLERDGGELCRMALVAFAGCR